jgi:2',3'-cyclic-nucleotide 2'-phosphodiesterase (5'-nucleotidase family)
LINIGGIRTTIGKGDIILKNVFEVMPFENELIIVKMKGADLQGLFEYYAKHRSTILFLIYILKPITDS